MATKELVVSSDMTLVINGKSVRLKCGSQKAVVLTHKEARALSQAIDSCISASDDGREFQRVLEYPVE